METHCHREVVELHRFFQDWFNGELRDDESFSRVADVLAETFVIVPPEGEVVERDRLLESLRQARGRWRQHDQSTGLIWIEQFHLRWSEGGVCLATYEEWQQAGSTKTGRLSTAIFRAHEPAPNGVVWLHVHEAWLPEP